MSLIICPNCKSVDKIVSVTPITGYHYQMLEVDDEGYVFNCEGGTEVQWDYSDITECMCVKCEHMIDIDTLKDLGPREPIHDDLKMGSYRRDEPIMETYRDGQEMDNNEPI